MTDRYLFLNYICLSICLSYARLSYARGREGEHNIKTDYLFNYLNSPLFLQYVVSVALYALQAAIAL